MNTYIVFGIRVDPMGDSDADLLGFVELVDDRNSFESNRPNSYGFFDYNEERYHKFEFERINKIEMWELTRFNSNNTPKK